MAMPNPITRLFAGSSERPPLVSFQFEARLRLVDSPSDTVLEEAADTALSILMRHAAGTALGPVVGIDFEQRSVVIEFTVEAESVTDLHGKIGDAMRSLEEKGPFRFHDSSTARLDPKQEEREMVTA